MTLDDERLAAEVRLAKASDAWMEKYEAFEKAKAEYFAAFTNVEWFRKRRT